MNKERYFTPENIGSQSGDMLAEVESLRTRHRQSLRPAQAALLVLDMQRYFLDDTSHAFIPAAPAIVPRLQRLIDACSMRKVPVIFTRHLNSQTDAGMMACWWRDLIRQEDPASGIIPELYTSRGTVIEKTQYDAFHGTGLEDVLRQQGIGQVMVSGVMTHLCCETTARSAFMRGFEVFFLVDATATYSSAFHRATLSNLAHGFAVPVLVEEVVSLLCHCE